MRPTDHLKSLAADDWAAATQHAFCTELAEGTLPEAKMRWYLVQDYMFVDGFVRLLASAIAKAPTLADGVPKAQFLGLVNSNKNTCDLRAFEALGTSDAERQSPPPPPGSFGTCWRTPRPLAAVPRCWRFWS